MADELFRLFSKAGKTLAFRARELAPGIFAQAVMLEGTLPSGETHVGQIATPADLVDVTLVLDTVQYAAGDVLSISALLPNVSRINGRKVYPFAIQVVDEDDQGQPFDLLFFRSNISIGAINNPYSIDDAGSRELLGWVSISALDYVDWGSFRVAQMKDTDTGWKMGLWETPADSRDIYIAAISRGTGTYTASGIRLKISLGQN